MKDEPKDEPKDLDDADRIIQVLVDEIEKLQSRLTKAKEKGFIDGVPVAIPKWNEYRSKAIAQLAQKNIEIREVKAWKKSFHKEFRTFRAVTDGGIDYQGVRAECREGVNKFCQLMDGLMAELTELRAENASLRSQLMAIQNPSPDAPGEGHDDWRNE